MRAVSEVFGARLRAEATTLALCLRIQRRDGVALGLTTHDRPLIVGGLTYDAAPGMQPSAISHGRAGEGHAMEITGALSEDGVREVDLIAGVYDQARATCLLIDWEAPDAGTMMLASGEIGAVTCGEGMFTAELRTALDQLEATVTERYSPTCRAALGDRRCRVDLALRTRIAHVTAVAGRATSVDAAAAPEAYRYGRMRVICGPAAGLERAIDGSSGNAITLRASVPGLSVGAQIELREGCDKRFATCRDRFGNIANFRGEPHVPGNDAMLRAGSA